MANWDAVVIGLGGVGSAAAHHLAARGCRVLGLDQHPRGHTLGSSHGKTRIIRQAYFEHPSYVPLLCRAYQLWQELELASGRQLYHPTGLVELGPADGVVIPGVLRSAAEHALAIEALSVDEVTRRWPGLAGPRLREHGGLRAVIEKDAGYLRVEDCVETHLQLAERAGATLRHVRPVRHWRTNGQAVEVTTDEGIEHAARLVIAGGPWSGRLLSSLGIPLRVLRKYQYWYQPKSPGYAQSDGFPCFFHETPSGYFYGFPDIGSEGLKVARHSGGTAVESPTSPHPRDRDEQRRIEDYLNGYLPGVGDQLKTQTGCYYTTTPDEHFIVDLLPNARQVAVIAGLSGHGFKFTSVLGELASQLAIDGATTLDTSLLRIGR
ncbi:Monomeric sarcosine oxidase [Stieleria maiorica]|uniref:Monomeric sarcosine oxidase n=1 Tax=Stieleria maiorica TaxID=2795974 RepID=A0A5B9MHS6_9BACT|nr:N-methyl-L-tryptophan oxidase [Stieleria maiorica]QEG00852.1 Monomeric sarcosine oxidase [Stieleria maiorica]